MTDQPPDRLSTDPASPFYDAAILAREVGVRFKGAERRDIEEYCISENWVRAPVPTARDRRGNPLTIKLTGPVEVWFKAPAPSG
jgi:Protein of unknown function (DUF3297)